MTPVDVGLHILLGLATSAYGAVIGAGGGFLIAPALILFFGVEPKLAAGSSLVVVLVNGLTATMAYGRQGRIDYSTGVILGLATMPGAVIGAYVASLIDPRAVRLIFGAVLTGIALFIVLRRPAADSSTSVEPTHWPWRWRRQLIDARGDTFAFSYNPVAAIAYCLGIGLLSSLLGIGGGILLTPALILAFGVPAHVATATAQVVLVASSGVGAVTHLQLGNVDIGRAGAMAIGGLFGAQIGATFARRLAARWLTWALAGALLVVGLRLALG